MHMEIDGGHDGEFSQATERFLTWFKSLPGSTFHPDIRIEDFRGKNAGRGIVATKDIEPDTILFTIPRQSIICAATSDLPAKLPQVFTSDDAQDLDSDSESQSGSSSPSRNQDSWTSLILILMYEQFCSWTNPQTPSQWKPYLDVIPSAFDTPMFWSPAEISQLQDSSLVGKIGKSEADGMIKTKILSVIHDHRDVFFPSLSPSQLPSDEELLSLAHRMGSAIMAYAFDLDKEDDDENENEQDEWVEDREDKTQMGMVPMADMLNADAEFNAFINHAEDCLTAVAIRPIAAGDEILNYYGPLASSELLRRYGYVTEKHARYDVVELPWGLVEDGLKGRLEGVVSQEEWEAVEKRVRENDEFEMEDSFVLERVSEDPDSTGRVNGDAVFSALPEELEEQVKMFLKAVKKVNPAAGEALSDKDVRNELYLDSVLRALKEREASYATSLEEDERIFNSPGGERRVQMAVWVRMGEKKVLREAQAWVSDKLGELRGRMSSTSRTRRAGDDGPSAKRQRN